MRFTLALALALAACASKNPDARKACDRLIDLTYLPDLAKQVRADEAEIAKCVSKLEDRSVDVTDCILKAASIDVAMDCAK
jgi:hypothetical protein